MELTSATLDAANALASISEPSSSDSDSSEDIEMDDTEAPIAVELADETAVELATPPTKKAKRETKEDKRKCKAPMESYRCSDDRHAHIKLELGITSAIGMYRYCFKCRKACFFRYTCYPNTNISMLQRPLHVRAPRSDKADILVFSVEGLQMDPYVWFNTHSLQYVLKKYTDLKLSDFHTVRRVLARSSPS